ncbi:MAG: GMC family oxidoreductase [Planctomycetota bacterium]|nr:GMC family oxidoreductase [Planctomycetota bacterium]
MIFTPQTLPSRDLQCDVCVIGSGAGGAAAAWSLSKAGFDVICLEAGGHFTEKDFSQDWGRASRQLYQENGQRLMKGNLYVPVAGGRCLGGSTVVNSGICFRIPETRFDSWHDSAGLDFSFSDFVGYIESVESMIEVTPSNKAVWGGNNAFCQAGLEKLGWSGGPMPRNAPGCIGCGSCHTGCPTGAKLSVARTFIPKSRELGARYVTFARATRFITEGDRVVGVEADLLDETDKTVVGSATVRAKAVVLAAGAIQSPTLLLRNGLGNKHVGRHLHVHLATGCIGLTDQLIEGWRGIPQGFYSDEFLASDEMILESFWASPEVFFQNYPFGSIGTKKILNFNRMVACGGTIADRSEGRVKPGARPDRSSISYTVGSEDKDRLVRLAARISELLLAAGATEIMAGIYGVPPISSMDEVRRYLDPEKIRTKQLMLVYSSHPQGTLRMGSDPSRSAVDTSGQLYGHKGLHVMDASVFPDVLGVNPQVTIMSLSLLLADRLAASLQ